ncbi:MAG: ABC transporter permease [Candidatus Cloacimonadaceae bacterium]|jgi:phospholipid/cholesterol/gamma-HCH transport system permease protein|nr:ABC transporter permease [Candidatus Cloacimonadota bacterium]MDX9950376.1 ABC transporter permease [Candidatus Syntrophosphaera sp.]NLN85457.1 ABC transporter permease [Candidatus Cloacimonadota bacterium]
MIIKLFSGVGAYAIFTGRILKHLPHLGKRRHEFLIQFKKIGIDSLPLIAFTSLFTGLVTALQLVYQGRGYIPDHLFSVLIGKSTMIELAPVLTALVLTGKIGAAIAAEIGSMRVSEQLDALQSMSVDPHEFLYLPRVAAGVLAFPALTIVANVIGIGSAWYFNWLRNGIHHHTFFHNMRAYFEPFDLLSGLVKATVFGFFITTLACYFGDRTTGGAEGVGRSTTQTVVYSATWVLVLDFVVAFILLGRM